ncbi:MAG TPA: endolytic transglycosylase MltG [Ignavibacteriaceae bacterium]
MAKTKFSNLLTKKQFIIVITFFFILMYILHHTFFTPNNYVGSSPQRFEITSGESLNSIVENLYVRGIIPNKTNMKIVAFIYGAEKKIRAARYEIPNGLNYLELVELFLEGKADYLTKVKVYEGATVKSVVSALKLDALIDSSAFIETALSKSFLDSLGIKGNSVEGYLFPGEYVIYERSNPREVINLFYNEFKKFVHDSVIYTVNRQKYSLHEIVTLASIVEGETNKISEMPAIAGVYYNRLRIGMKLQADPTVQYIQPNGWKRLNHQDLKLDNPYNTYKYFGLPPGPINNPGKEALKAAFNPEKNKYLYFVADGSGGHSFAKNYSQHLKLVREYRKWLASQKEN